jgi:uncharacterized glyoxalase superfamily protein PhnB
MSKKNKKKTKTSAKKAGKAMKPKKAKKTAAKKAAPGKKKVMAVPAGYHTVTPYLFCRGAADAIEFYRKAFGAKETVRMPGPEGRLMHAEVRIGSSMVMLSDENPDRGALAPPTIGGTAVTVFLYVPNVDKTFAQAVAAGATAQMPPTDMFWGDRFAQVGDPFGHNWAIATHTEDVSPKEMGRRMQAEAARAAAGGQ